MKYIFVLPLLFLITFTYAQNNAKLARLNEALAKAEITEGKCGKIVQKFYQKNNYLIYTASSQQCKKIDSTWVDVKRIAGVESNYSENAASTITITCKANENCMDKISFLGNRSLAQPSKDEKLAVKTTLSKREFTNLVATLSQLNTE